MIWSVFWDFYLSDYGYTWTQGFVLMANWEERLEEQLHMTYLMLLGIWRNIVGHILDWIVMGYEYWLFLDCQREYRYSLSLDLKKSSCQVVRLRDNRAGRGEMSWSELFGKCLIKGNRFCRDKGSLFDRVTKFSCLRQLSSNTNNAGLCRQPRVLSVHRTHGCIAVWFGLYLLPLMIFGIVDKWTRLSQRLLSVGTGCT